MKKRNFKYEKGGDVEAPSNENTPTAAEAKYESFGDAFKRNRDRGAKEFEYKGKKYTTETAEEKAKAKDEAARKEQAERVKKEKGLERVAPELDLLPIGKLAGAMGAGAAVLKGGEKAIKAVKAARAAKRAENAATSGAMKGEAAAGELRYKKGGSVASRRGDGIAMRGKTRGKIC